MSSNEYLTVSDWSDDSFTPSHSKSFGPVLHLLSDSSDTSSNCSLDIIEGASPAKQRRVQSDSELESVNNTCEYYEQEEKYDANWNIPQGNQAQINFSSTSGIKICQPDILNYTEAQDFYYLLATEDVFQIVVEETNENARQELLRRSSQRLNEWRETNVNEIKLFFGLIIWMGLVRLPKLNLYWSKDKLYAQSIPGSVLTRNRFQLLLRFIRIGGNVDIDANNQLSRINKIVEILNNNFQKYYDPDEVLYVHNSMPADEGLTIKLCSREKPQCRGPKIVKLSAEIGYTYSFRLYSGQKSNKRNSLRNATSNIVMSLCSNILGKGHTVYVDDFYTSVNLAEQLLANNTHLVGTLAKNSRGIPQEVKAAKLKRDGLIARENAKGITVMRWKGKKDVLMLSTKHSTEMVTVQKKSFSYSEPKLVTDYNLSNSSRILSKRKAKHKRWVLEILLNTCVVNALLLFNYVTRSNVSVTDFREKLAKHLLKLGEKGGDPSSSDSGSQVKARHEMKRKPGPTKSSRQCCKMCYKKNAELLGRMVAKNRTKKVVTYCGDCTDRPFLCLPCFNAVHRNMPM